MKKRFFYIALAMTFMCGCQNDSQTTSAVSSKSSHKPCVAIVPLIDSSSHQLDWNLSEEITCLLCTKLDQRGTLQLALPGKIKMQTKRLKELKNPFEEDIQWVKKAFAEEEFVVFLEMIEHEEVPHQTGSPAPAESLPADLNICVRIQIIDNRSQTPYLALSEIIQDSHFVPRQFTHYNFDQAPWNTEEFTLSPVGIAHTQLIKELRTRIEDYILLTQNIR
jgi:hypothetical protein